MNEMPAFVVYPNPAEDKVRIDELPLEAEVIITDGVGREVSRFFTNQTSVELNVQAYREGVYFVTLMHADVQSTQRFVKQ
jgi:hypothetical protein